MKLTRIIKTLAVAGGLAIVAMPPSVSAAEVTLRFHQQLPAGGHSQICDHALDRERREGEQRAHQDPALSSDAAGWKAPGVV